MEIGNLNKEPKSDDFVLVKFNPRNDRDVYYIAKVMMPKDVNHDIEVS